MQTTADKVRDLYNKHNPDNLRLGFGCELKDKSGRVIIFDNRMTFSVEEKPHILAHSEVEFLNFQTEKNLGKHPTVLQVLGMSHRSTRYELSKSPSGMQEVYILEDRVSIVFTPKGFVGSDIIITIDPNIALFKDLPQETQDKIYELIK